ncbi:hypothetical protein [Paenibacillus sp. 8b26]|uniref:hypothetical protein n=1 Tax=Paenibacillus sp. 8b26 TaxID=3424133 RepID=UPI003D661688
MKRKNGWLLCFTLIMSLSFWNGHAKAENETGQIPVLQSVQLSDMTGELKPAKYGLEKSVEFPDVYNLHSMFTDKTGKLIVLNYTTAQNELVFRSVDRETGETKWRTSLGSANSLRQTIEAVQENNEIIATSENKSTIFLHTINAQTGKITRSLSQPKPSGWTFMSWDYFMLKNNILLVSYSAGNQTTLRYLDSNGKLIKTKKINGTLQQASKDEIYATVSATRKGIVIKILDTKYKVKKEYYYEEESFWNLYFLDNGSFVVETDIKIKGEATFRLRKYNADGQFEWGHMSDAFIPYHVIKNQVFATNLKHTKSLLLEHGKAKSVLFQPDSDYIYYIPSGLLNFSRSGGIAFADSDTFRWIANLSFSPDSEVTAIWIQHKEAAIFDRDLSTLHIIRLDHS